MTPVYYDVQRNWSRIKPYLRDPQVEKVLVRDFNKYTWGHGRRKFKPGDVPHDFEDGDWYLFSRNSDGGLDTERYRRGPMPHFWRYVKSAACHWLVNFNLELARRVAPERPWRIVTSQAHSTVFDGKNTLFDFNFLALGISAKECLQMARKRGRELKPGQHQKVGMPDNEKWERRVARRRLVRSRSARCSRRPALTARPERKEAIETGTAVSFCPSESRARAQDRGRWLRSAKQRAFARYRRRRA
jgi:hypothetical protein